MINYKLKLYTQLFLDDNDRLFYLKSKNDLKNGVKVLNILEKSELREDLIDFYFKSFSKNSKKGFIYLATNPVNKNIFKIGMTRKNPIERQKTLNKESVFGDLIIIESWMVPDIFLYEAYLHRQIKNLRITKEFFKFDNYQKAIETIELELSLFTKISGIY